MTEWEHYLETQAAADADEWWAGLDDDTKVDQFENSGAIVDAFTDHLEDLRESAARRGADDRDDRIVVIKGADLAHLVSADADPTPPHGIDRSTIADIAAAHRAGTLVETTPDDEEVA